MMRNVERGIRRELTRNRNCFSLTETSFVSVTATVVALRGDESIKAISPKMPYWGERFQDSAETDFDLAALNDE